METKQWNESSIASFFQHSSFGGIGIHATIGSDYWSPQRLMAFTVRRVQLAKRPTLHL
jgi:hypothetical protein